jgi:hypothetical protein
MDIDEGVCVQGVKLYHLSLGAARIRPILGMKFTVHLNRLRNRFLNKNWFLSSRRDKVYSVLYASLRTKAAGDQFITDAQSVTFTDIKRGHKEKDVPKSVRSNREICLFDLPSLYLSAVVMVLLSNTESCQFEITRHLRVTLVSGSHTVDHTLFSDVR